MPIKDSTRVTYPGGEVRGRSAVVATVPVGDGYGTVVAETPFHPLDHTWPDQPADTGTIGGIAVTDCVTGAVAEGGESVHLGADIPVRRGTPGWHWLVVHVTAEPVAGGGAGFAGGGNGGIESGGSGPGGEVELVVDDAGRRALSAGHTACHLTALALNEALAGRWRKEVSADGLGHPDFDQTAIASSRILPGGSRDVYRLGKSLRRKGFVTEGLAEELPEIAHRVGDRLKAWIAADATVGIDSPGPELTARRTWHCALPEAEVSIPCGGTHLSSTSQLGTVAVTLNLSADGSELVMRTTTGPYADGS
ncbi:metal-dependent hydrolase [Streptosporangium sp. NBC_01495]|uniref:metal-dependent hydrolase n=1 Tax=Streptosporangium sp. NBC_01495 TaxID=2903899 RepID=UPI002E312D76|nr:metal-dependent hydrolase [Streptosporangium sp. NBC_01495]